MNTKLKRNKEIYRPSDENESDSPKRRKINSNDKVWYGKPKKEFINLVGEFEGYPDDGLFW
ncbi:MAG: hypothetical protein LBH55_04390 [Mycoplasmataceae bacterium]|jgi:hypothetical protein|nr:hypothetical protein [Mycoplasmataceae bacterium]